MKKTIATLCLLVFPFLLVASCRKPPSVEAVESFMRENKDDIVLINDYLLRLGDRDAIVHNDGSILIDLERQQIEDAVVMEAIRSLWREGCRSITKFNEDNAIVYCIWTRTSGSVDCGFVYAIDHTKPPEVQFQTELVPLSEEGWYYYIADYEEWRVLNKD